MKAHLFNPENDLALASGMANFTPSASVRRFKEALSQLPRWYADESDIILTPGAIAENPDAIPAPWGWSADAIRQFKKAGIRSPFPDAETIRNLSHRRISIKLHDLLEKSNLPYQLSPKPGESSDAAEISSNQIFIKAPWSCSGRGVVDCSNMTVARVRDVASGIIRRQGSVMIEPKLPKNQDFALLFESIDGKIHFKGISSFFNSSTQTAYGGNFCASQEEIREKLNARFLDETISAVTDALNVMIAPYYSGPLGVDMITYGPENLICPSIEINLRRTMGFVALSLYERLGRGIFRITPGESVGIRLIDPNPYFSATFHSMP
ncbi:MAG: hypothetical protein K2K82_07590 [Muribaculaceae bacterium]|nr:hypothetical protein [Muribaculaceae bacterium]